MADIKRRILLRGTLSASLVSIGASALLSPRTLLAANPDISHQSKTLDAKITEQYDYTSMPQSSAIKISAPAIAENSSEVPVLVSSNLPNVDSISILLKNNPTPLIAHFVLEKGTTAFARTRIKMPKTSDIIAIVRSNGKLFTANKLVRVVTGSGCGG